MRFWISIPSLCHLIPPVAYTVLRPANPRELIREPAAPNPIWGRQMPDNCRIRAKPVPGGLHHQYFLEKLVVQRPSGAVRLKP